MVVLFTMIKCMIRGADHSRRRGVGADDPDGTGLRAHQHAFFSHLQ